MKVVSMGTPADPRGEKIVFWGQVLGNEKLLEKWA